MAQEMINENYKARACNSKSRKFIGCFKNFLVVCSYIVIAMVFMSSFSFANNTSDVPYEDVFSEVDGIFDYVQSKLLDLSTGGVVIAVAIGIFMKKFSMGKQDKIETGNKVIRDSLIGYAVLNSMPIIAKTIRNFTSGALVR